MGQVSLKVSFDLGPKTVKPVFQQYTRAHMKERMKKIKATIEFSHKKRKLEDIKLPMSTEFISYSFTVVLSEFSYRLVCVCV